MKKIISIIAVLTVLCSVAFAEIPGKAGGGKKEDREIVTQYMNDYTNIIGTPEDSVLFYGGFCGGNDFIFTQINPDFEPDVQGWGHTNFFTSKPVKPGSRYMLEYWSWFWLNYTGSAHFTVQTTPLIVDVPEKPGIYYFGFYDSMSTFVDGELIENPRFTSIKERAGCLRKILKLYAGTAWEPVIKEELKKAEAEAKQNKKDRKEKRKNEWEDKRK